MENRLEIEDGNEPEAKPENSVEPAENVDRLTETPDPEEEVRPKAMAAFRAAFERARQPRNRQGNARPKNNPLVSDRTARNRDRTRSLFACVVGLMAVLIVFLAVFSSSPTAAKRDQAARRNPSLGNAADQAKRESGSVTPLLSAELSGRDPNGGQLTPEDISNTSRPRYTAEAVQIASAGPRPPQPGQTAASNGAPFADPALEAYRRQVNASGATPPRDVAPAPPPEPPAPEAPDPEALGKASLVYVRTNARRGRSLMNGAALLSHDSTTEPALREQSVWSGLPAGTRLIARLQSAVSTAVKAPVVAVIETHYERDGEIVVPAGTKALGELEAGTRSGYVGIRFHTLELPGGTTEKIEAGAMSLDYGPLKGKVTGRNRGKQFLARALSGVGTVAAFAVGHPGGLSGPMDNSILLRDRIAQNIGMAGEQEVMRLAYTQEIVVTVPGNTRFFIVLQTGAGRQGAGPGRKSGADTVVASSLDIAELPTAAELRELVALKQELNRMYREAVERPSDAPLR